MTVIALLDHCIQAAVGKSGKYPTVRGLYSVPCEEETWENTLADLFETKHLPKREVTLLLPRETVTTRFLTLPAMSSRARSITSTAGQPYAFSFSARSSAAALVLP